MYSAPVFVRPGVLRPAPFEKTKVPALLVIPFNALLLVSVVLTATSVFVPLREISPPLPIEVIMPLANSSNASPDRFADPVQVAGAAAVMSKVALVAAPPVRLIVPVLARPFAVTVVAVVRALFPMPTVPAVGQGASYGEAATADPRRV